MVEHCYYVVEDCIQRVGGVERQLSVVTKLRHYLEWKRVDMLECYE